ncbi:MAG: exodeoxyribonuclease I [Sphaerochaetaceae bacterium]|nr:exodeoxyribonuclease I [Sphaerochaetaceae bacterium]
MVHRERPVFKCLFYGKSHILCYINSMTTPVESFFWYDLETFGTDPFNDRIAQFAGMRTDPALNPIGDPVMLYCRLSPDYIPNRFACEVTGITPQTLKEKNALPECEFIERINAIFSVRGTCVVGFNNVKFDDEFIRNALYRNFMDPYEREYKNGCSRWDIINLVRACHDLRPEGITWPHGSEDNRPVFKLTEMTAANNIEQKGAHDALVDVRATIAVAKLIKEKQPKLFDYYLSLRDKENVRKVLGLGGPKIKAVLHTSTAFSSVYGATSLIVPVSPTSGMSNNIVCLDLAKDPAPLIAARGEELESLVFGKDSPVVRVGVNKIPFVAPANTIRENEYQRLGLDYRLCMQHLETILTHMESLVLKLRDLKFNDTLQNNDPDSAIYTGFFSDYDKNLFRMIRNTDPARRLDLKFNFQDPRCQTMLFRHVCRNYPELLNDEQMKKWKAFSSERLLSPPGGNINIYLTEEVLEREIENPETEKRTREIYSNLLSYLKAVRKYLGMKDRVN